MKRSKKTWRGLATVIGSVALYSASISISPVDAAVVQNPSNGHFYEFVPSYFTWSDARDAAARRIHLARPGYLATITSATEQAFIEQLLDGVSLPPINDSPQIWLGGSDVTQQGIWSWVTGPEAGTPFWQGNQDGVPIGGAFANWEALGGVKRQPDGNGAEDFLSIEFNPNPGNFPSDERYQWNDSSAERVGVGYLVEYEAHPAPALSLLTTSVVALALLMAGIVTLGRRRPSRA